MGKKDTLPDSFIKKLRSVKAKRPRTVIEHILKHGYITTDELKELYGYNHPPRAARDVREQGIPLVTERVMGPDGRKIARYKFGNPEDVDLSKHSGRTVLSKELKAKLIEKHGSKCFIYSEIMDERDLQIDHRIPYEVAGDSTEDQRNPDDFMLVCGSANRAKSWSCEHCKNWLEMKSKTICSNCYWAYPEEYRHVAMVDIRRLDIMWEGDEVAEYDMLVDEAVDDDTSIQAIVKKIIKDRCTRCE